MAKNVKYIKLSPIIKYPGGKEKELKYILPNLPEKYKRYYEPFVGGGAVYFSLDSKPDDNPGMKPYFINDKSKELINLYHMIKTQNKEFLEKLSAIDHNWTAMGQKIQNHMDRLLEIYLEYKNNKIDAKRLNDAVSELVSENEDKFCGLLDKCFDIAIERFIKEIEKNLKSKMKRMKKLEAKKGDLSPEDLILNLECAFKSAFYMYFRYLYNHTQGLNISSPIATAIYFFVREFCYASMYRYNKKGEFNVPYGGISYNKKSISKKVQYFESEELVERLGNTVIEDMDFEVFFKKYIPQNDDFVFLDPPYDTEFSTYAQNKFGKEDQKRLAEFLIKQCKANFMLIIKNTDFIRELYPANLKTANGKQLYVGKFDKKYVVSFQDRNDKDAEHLLITNYQISF